MRDPFVVIAESLAAARKPRPRGEPLCYVALGDSFTAGKGCAPAERWADRLATGLGMLHSPVGYYNLATDGATSADVLERQLGEALQLEPDLVTLMCGANDVLSSVRPDADGYRGRLAAILDGLRAGMPRAAILTATTPEGWRFLELRPRTRARVMRGIRGVNAAQRRDLGGGKPLRPARRARDAPPVLRRRAGAARPVPRRGAAGNQRRGLQAPGAHRRHDQGREPDRRREAP